LGIDVAYETEAIDFAIRDGRFIGATAMRHGAQYEIRAKSLVVASGGFESNLAWLREAWGPAADNFIVRGTPYNDGRVLKLLLGRFMPPLYPPIAAQSIATLATALGIDAAALEKTIADFNAAVRAGTFDHTSLDDCHTEGVEPPKTHWARAIDTPPYHAYPLR